ncbi:MAG: hypothetical protein ACLPVY_19470 [Acidimicrobiia bacterium]
MSISVDLAALRVEVSRFGARALLVTTSGEGPPHVTSVLVVFDGDSLAMRVGRRTHGNAEQHPAVALVWTAGIDDYCLIVDGAAQSASSDSLLVVPTSVVLHRLATVPNEIDHCVPIDGPGEGSRNAPAR